MVNDLKLIDFFFSLPVHHPVRDYIEAYIKDDGSGSSEFERNIDALDLNYMKDGSMNKKESEEPTKEEKKILVGWIRCPYCYLLYDKNIGHSCYGTRNDPKFKEEKEPYYDEYLIVYRLEVEDKRIEPVYERYKIKSFTDKEIRDIATTIKNNPKISGLILYKAKEIDLND